MNQQTAPQNASRTYRRRTRNILIHKPMQREFAMVLIGLLMVSTLAVGYVIHTTIRDVAFGSNAFSFGKTSAYEILSDISYELLVKVSCILFVTLIVVGAYGVFFLHRVAGPVYRFRQVFLRLNDGEVPPNFNLREGDFFTETAVEVNRLIKRMRFEKVKEDKMKDTASRLVSAAGGNESVAKPARELKSLIEEEYREESV